MRTALAALLSAEPTLDFAGAAADADEAVELALRHRPAVCVVDVTMPGGGGPRATREIRRCCPGTEVLALSGREDRESVVEMLRAGACGYLVKGAEADDLVRAVRDAALGRRTLSPTVADSVVSEPAEHLAREDADRSRRRERMDRIERALARGPDIALQPIVDLATRAVVGYEALSRFPAEPVRSPARWFAEAAETGRLLELELAAVRAALARLPELPGDTRLALNLSPITAASDAFRLALPLDGSTERLVVEITEHAPIEDYELLEPSLRRLRRLGVHLAIDDAGAGFASLRHILRLAPEVIKLDMTLTRRIETDRAERALTRALISFAAEIEATIIAEGVESEAEIDALRELGVAFGQGFHLGRPSTGGLPGRQLSRARRLA